MNDTTNLNSGSDDEVQFIASVKTSTPKTGRFILSEDAVKIIESVDWLTDHIIGAAHSVLETNSLTSVEWKIQLWVQSTISLYKGESSPKCSVLVVVTGYWLRTSDAPVHKVRPYDSLLSGQNSTSRLSSTKRERALRLLSLRYKDRITTMTVGYLLSPFWSPYSTE